MIVRITFEDNHIMLFGNSYTDWLSQFREYAWRFREQLPERPVRVEVSRSKWLAWGGLKWVAHQEFQHQLNREGCPKQTDPDNPKPRRYPDMKFGDNKVAFIRVAKILGDNAKRVAEYKAKEGIV